MLHALATGELDISFVTGQYDIRGYRSRILWNETIYLVIPTGHPLARQEVVTWEELREKVSS